MSSMSKRLAQKKQFVPESGYNVVGVDSFEKPGEELYLIAHVDTEKEANAIAAKKRKAHSDKVYVFGPRS